MTNLYEKLDRPQVQATAIFVAALPIMGIGWGINASGLMKVEPLFAWSIATAFLLFFALLNSLMSIRATNIPKYWGTSIYSYLGLAFVTAMAAWGFSGTPIREAGSYRWIYIVVTVGFLVFLSMVNFMKIIVRYAEKEEWNQPRKQ